MWDNGFGFYRSAHFNTFFKGRIEKIMVLIELGPIGPAQIDRGPLGVGTSRSTWPILTPFLF